MVARMVVPEARMRGPGYKGQWEASKKVTIKGDKLTDININWHRDSMKESDYGPILWDLRADSLKNRHFLGRTQYEQKSPKTQKKNRSKCAVMLNCLDFFHIQAYKYCYWTSTFFLRPFLRTRLYELEQNYWNYSTQELRDCFKSYGKISGGCVDFA